MEAKKPLVFFDTSTGKPVDDPKFSEAGVYIRKEFGKDFHSEGGALTLRACEVHEGEPDRDTYSRTHESGWTITGEVHEDYFTWVNEFTAEHPKYGKVWGDFETEVFADSEEGFQHFWKHHEPEAWDYMDI